MFNIDFQSGDQVTSCVFIWSFLKNSPFGKGNIVSVCDIAQISEIIKRVDEYNRDVNNSHTLQIDMCGVPLVLNLG